jgi:hydroxyethylthiazole kinase-like sugar kinase family protein
MLVTPGGKARVGDVVLTPDGELREIVWVIGAGDLIGAMSAQALRLRTPSFWINSTAANCALFGSTSAREKRDNERRRHRSNKLIRSVA